MANTLTREAVQAELSRRKSTDKAVQATGRSQAIENGTFGMSKAQLREALEGFAKDTKVKAAPKKTVNRHANEVFAQIKKQHGVKAAFQARAQVIRQAA